MICCNTILQYTITCVLQYDRSLPNLAVRPSSVVERLRWREGGPPGRLLAEGVEVVEFGDRAVAGTKLSAETLEEGWEGLPRRRYLAKAREAVLLSSGAFGTPALLQRSGVGRRGDTPEEPRLERPMVGAGLRDRLAVGIHIMTSLRCEGDDNVEQGGGRHTDIPQLFSFFNFSEAGNRAGALGAVEAEANIVEFCRPEGKLWLGTFILRVIMQRTHRPGRVIGATQLDPTPSN